MPIQVDEDYILSLPVRRVVLPIAAIFGIAVGFQDEIVRPIQLEDEYVIPVRQIAVARPIRRVDDEDHVVRPVQLEEEYYLPKVLALQPNPKRRLDDEDLIVLPKVQEIEQNLPPLKIIFKVPSWPIDDSDLPLVVVTNTLDEEFVFTRPPAIGQRPVSLPPEDEFVLPIQLDEEQVLGSVPRALGKAPSWPIDEDAVTVVGDEDVSLLLVVAKSAQPPTLVADDDLPVTAAATIVEEEYTLPIVLRIDGKVLSWAVDSESVTVVGDEDSVQTRPPASGYRVFALPADEEIVPQPAATIVSEDDTILSLTLWKSQQVVSLPENDEVVPTVGGDEDSVQGRLPALIFRVSVLPADEEIVPQPSATVVEEDVLLSLVSQTKQVVLSYPIDEEIVPQPVATIVDEDVLLGIVRIQSTVPVRYPIDVDSVTVVGDEDPLLVVPKRVSIGIKTLLADEEIVPQPSTLGGDEDYQLVAPVIKSAIVRLLVADEEIVPQPTPLHVDDDAGLVLRAIVRKNAFALGKWASIGDYNDAIGGGTPAPVTPTYSIITVCNPPNRNFSWARAYIYVMGTPPAPGEDYYFDAPSCLLPKNRWVVYPWNKYFASKPQPIGAGVWDGVSQLIVPVVKPWEDQDIEPAWLYFPHDPEPSIILETFRIMTEDSRPILAEDGSNLVTQPSIGRQFTDRFVLVVTQDRDDRI